MGNMNTQHVRVRTAMVNTPNRHERQRPRPAAPGNMPPSPSPVRAVPAGRHFRPEGRVVATRSEPEQVLGVPVAGLPTCGPQTHGQYGSETSTNFPAELAKAMNANSRDRRCSPRVVSSSVTWKGYAGASQSDDAGVYMAAKNAHEIAHYAHRTHELIAMGVKLPPWCSQYLSMARAAMGSVYHYLGHPQAMAAGVGHREMAWRNAREIEAGAELVEAALFDRGEPVPGWVDDLLAKIRYWVGTVGHYLSIEPPTTGGFAGARACKRCKAHWTPPTNRERRYGNGYRI